MLVHPRLFSPAISPIAPSRPPCTLLFTRPPWPRHSFHQLLSPTTGQKIFGQVMGIGTFRIGHAAAAAKNNHKKAIKRDSCSTGGFITSPTSGQEVDVSDDVMFAWDSSCLNITGADIYLFAPYQETSLIQMFQNVDFSKGSYNATLKPKWWNSTKSVNLQLTIVKTGTPQFSATLPPGPIWTAKYNASDKNAAASSVGTTSSSDANITQVNNLQSAKSSGISKGGIAAAVLVPLIVIGLALFAYVKISRKREEARRKRWSEAVDKRMSVLSVDWRSMSARGAEAAIRASMADPNRSSVWSASGNAGVGVPRPSSTYAVEGSSDDQPEMAQIRRPGVGPRGPVASTAGSVGRVSRVSFAADTRFSRSSGDGITSRGRPSVESRRAGVPSRAFHSAYMPPIPSRLSEYVPDVETSNNTDGEDNNGILMSPTQRNGPLDLSADDIRARMNGDTQSESRLSLDAVMPALTMMRTGNDSQADLLLECSEQPQASVAPLRVETTLPAPPPVAKSPIMEAMPMQPLSASTMMSPDEMLRAYAESRRTGGSGMTSPPGTPAPAISFPMPVVSAGSVMSPPSTMRTLYSPSGTTFAAGSDTASAHSGASSESTTNPFRKSMAVTRSSSDTQNADEDAYVGAAH